LFERKALAEDASVDNDGSGFKGFTLSYNARSEREVDEIILRLRNKEVHIKK